MNNMWQRNLHKTGISGYQKTMDVDLWTDEATYCTDEALYWTLGARYEKCSSSRLKDIKQQNRSVPGEYCVATHLAKLDCIDPRRVLKIRNIKSLGHQAAELLQAALSTYGTVETVLLCGDGQFHRRSLCLK